MSDTCQKCKGTGVIETGNNDLPCECSAGDTARFNVAGLGNVSGEEARQHLVDLTKNQAITIPAEFLQPGQRIRFRAPEK